MTTERDELRIKLLELGGTISSCWPERGGKFDQAKAERAVDESHAGILAAGYTKPRPEAAASVKAMEAVDAALERYSKGEYASPSEFVRDVARASGAYSVERLG